MKTAICVAMLSVAALAAPVQAQDIKIALIAGKTGALEAYAKQTETGFMMGLEYATKGTNQVLGRKVVVKVMDDQLKPDVAKSLLEQAYGDDNADLAVGTTASPAALAMLPVAEEYKKVLIVEPAVADQITGDKWNRYVFRTARNSSQDAIANAAALAGPNTAIAMLAQDTAFGRDGVAAFREALAATKSGAQLVHEEYAPFAATDFTAAAQHLFDALKDKPGRKVIAFIWAGLPPVTKIADLKPERFGIELAPGGNLLPVMAGWKTLAGATGATYYYWGFPKNPVNDWLVSEHQKRFHAPPDFFTAGGMAAAMAAVAAIEKAGGTDTEALIKAMEGLAFQTPKGEMRFRPEDHQAMQVMYQFKIKANPPSDTDLLDLVREIPVADMPVPIRNKR